jgi:serine/threonine protein kinase
MPPLFPLANGQTYTVAGKYDATRILGEGRFSVVYHAYDRRNARDVALKAYFSSGEDAWQRSKAEEKTLKSVSTLNSPFFPKLIQAIKTLVEHTNHPVLVLELGEYVDPSLPPKSIVTLKAVLDGVRSDSPEVGHAAFWQPEALRDFCLDLCQAVAELHTIGIIHRDIKPSNVLLKRSAGSARVYPFILDFNAVSDSSSEPAGTHNYLPPEVTAGPRSTPAIADDLWAVSRLIWELFHGEGSAPGATPKFHARIATPPPAPVVDVLRKALSPNVVDRPSDASTLREQLEQAFTPAVATAPPTPEAPAEQPSPAVPTRSDFHLARAAAERIRDSIIYTLETGDAPPVPKEIRELVALAMETSADGSSTAVDLKADLVGVGPKAFPAILEQCYKLRAGSLEWALAREALVQLTADAHPLATKTLRHYCTSSSYAVRAMCLDVCDLIEYVPDELLDLLANDDGLLGPSERQQLLNHIFAHASDPSIFLTLVTYMCSAVIVDERRYPQLRDTIATRLRELPHEQRAVSLFEDAEHRVWKDAPAYREKPTADHYRLDLNAARLMSETFASLDEATDALVARHVNVRENRQAAPWAWTVWLEFLKRTLKAKPQSAQTFVALARKTTDVALTQELERLLNQQQVTSDEIPPLIDAYLNGADESPRTFNNLRFDHSGQVANIVREALLEGATAEECDRALRLLEGFEGRARNSVVKCVLDNWALLHEHDLERACGVLSQASIRNERLKESAKAVLNDRMRTGGEPCVRDALAQILAGH